MGLDYRHYISTREDGAIIKTWSNGLFPDRDVSKAICIDEHGSYQFRFYPDGEENPLIYDEYHIPLYKWDGKKVVLRSDKEIEADRSTIPPSPPSEMEQLRADVDYLLAIGGLV